MIQQELKEKLQNVNRKVYSLFSTVEKSQYVCIYRKYNSIELHMLDTENFGNKIKIEYDDIVKLDINGINIYIELNDGTSYFLKEIRNDLRKIFTDFKSETLDISINGKFYIIKDYSLIGQDYNIYILRGITIYNEELGDLEENEYINFKYKLRFDDIKTINEDYEEGYHNLLLGLTDGQYVEFTSEWNGDNYKI